ncbi:MAG TPA: arylsulfatase, partial [Planctomycetia bacterium]|nr:arylsulfatase [Planctomycetia bacterium]
MEAGEVLTIVLIATLAGGEASARPPNLVVILADDLGFSDLGCYGGETRTPHLDALAAGGLRYSQFYNCARCWPTRAALLSGYYPQHVGRDGLPGMPGGASGKRPAWAKLLPERLRAAGYRSYHSGKWHVDGSPRGGGFDRSYLMQDGGRYFSPRNHSEDDRKLPSPAPEEKYYSTTAIADHAVSYLARHAAEHREQPFFLYLAFLAPHFPLQALPEDIARYRDAFGAGWDVLRRQRHERQTAAGIVVGKLSALEPEIGPPYRRPDDWARFGPGEAPFPRPWSELTDAQRDFQATKMAIHAAMIDRMDQEIGRVLAQLRRMNAWDDTLILFLSDNGASAEIMIRDEGHDPAAPPGSAATHLCLGPGWSSAANTPFRRHKTWVYEGGIATPLIAHWPKGISERGKLRHAVGHVVDIAPTLLNLAGEKSSLENAPTAPGVSLAPTFVAEAPLARDSLWWAHEGNRAIRVGDWKLVAVAKGPWELYDLARDRTETENLAAKEP